MGRRYPVWNSVVFEEWIALAWSKADAPSPKRAAKIRAFTNWIASEPIRIIQLNDSVSDAYEKIVAPWSRAWELGGFLVRGMRWELNLTGGPKMFPLLIQIMFGFKSVSGVTLRTYGGQWQSILRKRRYSKPDIAGPSTSVKLSEIDLRPNPASAEIEKQLESIDVTDYIWLNSGNRYESSPDLTLNLNSSQILEVSKNKRETKKWVESIPAEQNHCGLILEYFAYQVCKEIGLKTAHSCRIVGERSQHELDVIGIGPKGLVLVDCKLSEEPDKCLTEVIRCAEDARLVGGESARAIMLRPSWGPKSDIQEFLLASRMPITLLTCSEMHLFPQTLEKITGLNSANIACSTSTITTWRRAFDCNNLSSMISIDDKLGRHLSKQGYAKVFMGDMRVIVSRSSFWKEFSPDDKMLAHKGEQIGDYTFSYFHIKDAPEGWENQLRIAAQSWRAKK